MITWLSRLRVRQIALLVAALIAAVVTVTALASRHAGGGPVGAPRAASPTVSSSAGYSAASPSPSRSPRPGDDGTNDDDTPDLTVPSYAVTASPTDPREAAVEFLVKWINTEGRTTSEWRAGWHPLVTPDLAALLDEADPSRVPVGRVGAAAAPVPAGDQQVVVVVAIVANTDWNKVITKAKLTLVVVRGRWLVSQLDQVSP